MLVFRQVKYQLSPVKRARIATIIRQANPGLSVDEEIKLFENIEFHIGWYLSTKDLPITPAQASREIMGINQAIKKLQQVLDISEGTKEWLFIALQKELARRPELYQNGNQDYQEFIDRYSVDDIKKRLQRNLFDLILALDFFKSRIPVKAGRTADTPMRALTWNLLQTWENFGGQTARRPVAGSKPVTATVFGQFLEALSDEENGLPTKASGWNHHIQSALRFRDQDGPEPRIAD
jgi:hypothetical protein